MIRLFDVFNARDEWFIEIDDSKTIAELVVAIYDKYGVSDRRWLEYTTVYDTHNKHVIIDRNSTIASNNMDEHLCLTYFVKDKFLFVEGGWGYYMMNMDALHYIKGAVQFEIPFKGIFGGQTYVASDTLTIEELYNALRASNLIEEATHVLSYDIISKKDRYKLQYEKHTLEDAFSSGMTVAKIIEECVHPALVFKKIVKKSNKRG